MGLENLSALWNIELSVNQGVICTGLYRQAFGNMFIWTIQSPQFKESRIPLNIYVFYCYSTRSTHAYDASRAPQVSGVARLV